VRVGDEALALQVIELRGCEYMDLKRMKENREETKLKRGRKKASDINSAGLTETIEVYMDKHKDVVDIRKTTKEDNLSLEPVLAGYAKSENWRC
jgi:hypothetical protein